MTHFVAAQARHSYAFSHRRKSSHRSSNSSSKGSGDSSSDKPEEKEEEQPVLYGGNDEYVNAIKEISGKYPAANLKKGQRAAADYQYMKHSPEWSSKVYETAQELEKIGADAVSSDLDNRGRWMAMARYGMSSDNISNILYGAKIYEKLGQGGRASVKRRLVRGFERMLHTTEEKYKTSKDKDRATWDADANPSLFVNKYAPQVETFLKKNPTLPSTTLEKTVATASVIGFLGGAFFSSAKLTGNVIGLSTQTSSIVGVGLLIVGLIAGFSWIKIRNK